jgi:hypothetical protein
MALLTPTIRYKVCDHRPQLNSIIDQQFSLQSQHQIPSLISSFQNNFKMHAKSVVAALLFAGAQALPQGNGATVDPNQITIIDTAYSGSGCPQGSVSTSTSPDKTV